jgi:hypothetical protein
VGLSDFPTRNLSHDPVPNLELPGDQGESAAVGMLFRSKPLMPFGPLNSMHSQNNAELHSQTISVVVK